MLDKLFWHAFAKRSLICFVTVIVLFFTCVLRISVIANSNYLEFQEDLCSVKMEIAKIRGTIFDCNGKKITNTKKKIIACVVPTERTITAISNVLTGEERERVLATLKNNRPATCEVPYIIECDGITCTEIYESESQIPSIHTIGYVDSQKVGVAGIEKAYDDILHYEEAVTVKFACDGKGRILNGITPKIQNHFSQYSNSVTTTLDLRIQSIVEEESDHLGKGSVIVADAKTSKIRAIASRPNYTLDQISKVLNDENTPLYNRSFGAYNVGSVFKPCVAISGLQSGHDNFLYECTGKLEVMDRIFRCHKLSGHGKTDLENAIAHSCNTYFYNYALKTGAKNILHTASSLNFGKNIKLGQNIYTASGTIPTEEKLANVAHLANFSIGQGNFTASPISLLPLYSAIANDGKYYIPSLIESTEKNGKKQNYNYGYPTKVFDITTAQKLKKSLSLVVNQGTGVAANPKTVTAAGKTATAQTGKYQNGKEIISSWFCGFFPLENPKYVIIVFCEDNSTQSKTCGEIFANIADKINLNT